MFLGYDIPFQTQVTWVYRPCQTLAPGFGRATSKFMGCGRARPKFLGYGITFQVTWVCYPLPDLGVTLLLFFSNSNNFFFKFIINYINYINNNEKNNNNNNNNNNIF